MINVWSIIVNAVFSMLEFLLGLLPAVNTTVTTNIATTVGDLKTKLAVVDSIFPISTFFSVLGFIVIIESALWLYKFILWIGSNLSAGFIKK